MIEPTQTAPDWGVDATLDTLSILTKDAAGLAIARGVSVRLYRGQSIVSATLAGAKLVVQVMECPV